MILGIGIDSIEIARFTHWPTRPRAYLRRIYTPEELDYCLQDPRKCSERLAIRFAAKEACYKALMAAFPCFKIPFLTFAPRCQIKKDKLIPFIEIEPHSDLPPLSILISLTHTRKEASAYALVQKV